MSANLQLVDLHQVWRGLQKNAKKTQDVFKQRQQAFTYKLYNLFDIAHADAFQLIKIEEDKIFLKHQREPGRVGYLGGVDKKLSDKEKRAQLRATEEENRRMKYLSASTSLVSNEPVEDNLFSISDENIDSQNNQQITIENTQPETGAIPKVPKKNFITSKLVAALDRCQLSMRDSVFILQATIEALGYNTDEYPISKSSIQQIRTEKRKERAEAIKIDFKNEVPDVVTVHWDGKLLPALNARHCKEERQPIVISYGNKEQLIAVPKLDSYTGKEQAQAVWNAIIDWDFKEKVQILCCDTTASNTGRLNGACILLEQKLERELLIFACRHHVYELVLKSVFEIKISQVTTSPDIPLFKKFRENWINVDHNMIRGYREKVEKYFTTSEIEALLTFYHAELKKKIVRDDYRELIELSVIFLNEDPDRKLKIRPCTKLDGWREQSIP